MDERATKHVGVRIRAARVASGLSQKEFAHRLSISKQQAWKYENGGSELTATRLCQIAELLGVRPSVFFKDVDAPDGVAARTGAGRDEKPDILEVYGKLDRSNRDLLLSIGRLLLEVNSAAAPVPVLSRGAIGIGPISSRIEQEKGRSIVIG
jgi:transcriptional regulator with XRE-family HTH domain